MKFTYQDNQYEIEDIKKLFAENKETIDMFEAVGIVIKEHPFEALKRLTLMLMYYEFEDMVRVEIYDDENDDYVEISEEDMEIHPGEKEYIVSQLKSEN